MGDSTVPFFSDTGGRRADELLRTGSCFRIGAVRGGFESAVAAYTAGCVGLVWDGGKGVGSATSNGATETARYELLSV